MQRSKGEMCICFSIRKGKWNLDGKDSFALPEALEGGNLMAHLPWTQITQCVSLCDFYFISRFDGTITFLQLFHHLIRLNLGCGSQAWLPNGFLCGALSTVDPGSHAETLM